MRGDPRRCQAENPLIPLSSFPEPALPWGLTGWNWNSSSRHRVAVRRGIASGRVMAELALDVAEQRARADAEEVVLHPLQAELFLHQDQPGQRVLGGAQAAGRLEADLEA